MEETKIEQKTDLGAVRDRLVNELSKKKKELEKLEQKIDSLRSDIDELEYHIGMISA